MRFGALVKIAAATLLAMCGAPAAAQNWETITQTGGYKVARVAMSGAATGIGLTCERGTAVIAINLTRSPRRNPALLTLKNGAASGALPIIRNGATNVWAGVIKDARLLDGLATGQSVTLAVDGANYGTASLTGANAAMGTALAGCWRPVIAATERPGDTAQPTKVLAGADQSSPEAVQTSFPLRDPKTGKPRLPVKLGAWIPFTGNCVRPDDKLMFVDIGFSLGEGEPAAINELKSIRLLRPKNYAVTEDVGVQDSSVITQTYFISSPEELTVSPSRGRPITYRYCPQSSLPITSRRFLESEHRKLQALPVPAGYYEIWATDENPPRPTCQEYCGYLLINDRGIAQATRSAFAEPKGKIDRVVLRSPNITQDAPLHYSVKGSADWPYFGFAMTGNGGFTVDADGEGSTVHLRRVDPARIPAAMMPRF